jgi:hypothetical protein
MCWTDKLKIDNHSAFIKHHYLSGDTTALFQTLLDAAQEIGLPQALARLEACVIEKRLAWLESHPALIRNTDHPIQDGYRLFYENYLGVSIPQDGEIVRQNQHEIVMRWWNRCPTLEACQKFNLNTREVCRLAYHKPVQIFLARVHPGLRFERNYQALRPHCGYCEEMITLEG